MSIHDQAGQGPTSLSEPLVSPTPQHRAWDCTSRGSILYGDCLQRLGELGRVAAGRFDLVYVDPPFNAGGNRKARLAPGEDRASGTHAYVDHFGAVENFLSMLRPRLEALRPCMSDTSSLWLHLSHHTVHEAKAVADKVFGRSHFQGEIIWVPGNGGRKRTGPSVTHQTILIYRKGARMRWNGSESVLREPYADTSLRMHFRSVDTDGRKYRERVIGGKAYRYYADQGRRIGSVWTDCPAMSANTPLTQETTGYPTQKPEKLLERIIVATTSPDSWVLDPMCGSGTTVAVAARLGRPCVGIDKGDVAYKIASERLQNALTSRAAGS